MVVGVAVVVVDGVVGVVVVVALAAALAAAALVLGGVKVDAFTFHFIFTIGGLVGGSALVPLARFLFLSLGERASAILSQCAPLSADAAAIRSAIVSCGGASMRRSPLLPRAS